MTFDPEPDMLSESKLGSELQRLVKIARRIQHDADCNNAQDKRMTVKVVLKKGQRTVLL